MIHLFSPKAMRRALGHAMKPMGGEHDEASAPASAADAAGGESADADGDDEAGSSLDVRPLDYVLVVLTDVRRIPLPTYTDPCAARWFTKAAGIVEGKDKVGRSKGGSSGTGTHFTVSKEEAARYAAAEKSAKQWLKQEASLSASLVSELAHFEDLIGYERQGAMTIGPADPTIAGWHVIAEALYPFEGAAGFVRFRRVAEANAKLEGEAAKDKRVKQLVSSYG